MTKKKFPPNRSGNVVLDAGELQVQAWWNKLPAAERLKIARTIYPEIWDTFDKWDCAWEELSPIGQQMRIHMHFDGAVRHDE